MMYKILNDIMPSLYLKGTFISSKVNNVHSHYTRRANHDLILPLCRTAYCTKSVKARGTASWNSIDKQIRDSKSIQSFKMLLRHEFLR